MEIPQPPPEQELKNIIDKLAQFVARNGPEFEQMTKQKQKDNPKFSFLFGGEFFNYYQYRVTTEQAILRQKQRTPGDQQAIVQHVVNQQSIQSAPWQQQQQQQQHLTQPPLAPDMHEQIRQSEQNLAAQHQLLMQQQQVQIDEALRKAMDDKITGMATECGLSLEDLDNILQPIIDNCTKDSISTGKGWIFANAVSGKACEVTTQHILRKVTAPGVTFETKLHLVYLINDVLHHCMRKNADDLKKTLDRIVVPMFCSTSIGADPDQQQKLLKLFNLWETNKYFSQQILDQLQNPVSSLAAYQTSLISEFSSVITPITTAIQNQYAMLQKQHRDFVAHLTNQMHHFQHIPYAYQSPQNPPVMAVHPAATLPYSVLPQPPHVVPQQPLHPLDPQQLQRPPPQLPQQITQQQPPLQQMQPQQPPQQFQQQMPQIQQQPPPVDVHQPPPNQQVQQQQQFNQDQNQQLQPEAKPQVQQENHQQEQEQLQNVPSSSSSSDDSGQQQQTKQQAEAAQSDDNSNPPSSEAHTQVQSTPSDSPLPPSSSSSLSTASSSSSDQSTNVSVPQISVPSSNYNVANISHPASHYGNIPEDCRQGHPPGGPPPPHYRDDFPPRYGQPPPPRMGYVDGPDYRMTPPHMASYNGPPPPPLFGPPPPRGMPMRLNHHDGMPHRPMPPEYMEPMLPPTPPYYDLPAGLMVPLVKLEDTDYGMPLDPKDIRLPPPSLPTDRLLAAVELFYSPPSHDRARNSEGWEQLGLYEYFKAKSQAKKQKQNENSGSGEDSQESITSRVSGTDGTVEQSSKKESENQPPRRRYREFKSPDKEQADTEQSGRNESHRKSHSRSRSRSRSRSPARRRSPSRRSYSRRSRSRSPSPSSRKRSPERSPTPPSFFAGAYPVNPLDRRLDESNKGHQLLKKMGWSGSGLGATEQGIQDPVDAGEVRDRQDMYKGIGINLNDPYENFRKCKGQAFINRMKARAEELEDRF